mgnify:FL=1
MLKVIVATPVLARSFGTPSMASESADSRLLRKRHLSEITGKERECDVFLPRGYGADLARRWLRAQSLTRASQP